MHRNCNFRTSGLNSDTALGFDDHSFLCGTRWICSIWALSAILDLIESGFIHFRSIPEPTTPQPILNINNIAQLASCLIYAEPLGHPFRAFIEYMWVRSVSRCYRP